MNYCGKIINEAYNRQGVHDYVSGGYPAIGLSKDALKVTLRSRSIRAAVIRHKRHELLMARQENAYVNCYYAKGNGMQGYDDTVVLATAVPLYKAEKTVVYYDEDGIITDKDVVKRIVFSE